MSGILDGLSAEAYDRHYTDRELLRRIFRLLHHERGLLLRVSGTLLGSTLIGLVVPYGVSQALTRTRLDDLPLTAGLVLVVALAGALSWGLQYIQRLWTRQAMANVVMELQQQAFGAAVRQDGQFYEATTQGQVVSRITGDTQSFSLMVTLTLGAASQIVLVVGVLVMLWTVHAPLAAAVTLLIPVVVGVAALFRAWARQSTQKTQRAVANINTSISEAIGGLAVAKSFGQESVLLEEFRAVNETAYRLQVQQGMIYSSIYPVLGVLTGVAVLLVAYLGGRAVIAGGINIGQWYLFVQALDYFIMPLTGIAAFWSQFQQGLAAAERVFALIDHPLPVHGGHLPLPKTAARIELREIVFAYPGGTKVLDGFSLTLTPGETVALIGETGAGKSTVAKLLTGQYRAQGGGLLINGIPIEDYDLTELRRHVGYVSQHPFLFAGTVMDNIRLGRADASTEEVEAAAHALLPGWTEQLPGGLDTRVGERGQGISLGQRQLVVLARILLQAPPILVLDEATANIDPWTELQFLRALATVQHGRTCLFIAHRKGTIAHAQRAVRLQGGQGRPEALPVTTPGPVGLPPGRPDGRLLPT